MKKHLSRAVLLVVLAILARSIWFVLSTPESRTLSILPKDLRVPVTMSFSERRSLFLSSGQDCSFAIIEYGATTDLSEIITAEIAPMRPPDAQTAVAAINSGADVLITPGTSIMDLLSVSPSGRGFSPVEHAFWQSRACFADYRDAHRNQDLPIGFHWSLYERTDVEILVLAQWSQRRIVLVSSDDGMLYRLN